MNNRGMYAVIKLTVMLWIKFIF